MLFVFRLVPIGTAAAALQFHTCAQLPSYIWLHKTRNRHAKKHRECIVNFIHFLTQLTWVNPNWYTARSHVHSTHKHWQTIYFSMILLFLFSASTKSHFQQLMEWQHRNSSASATRLVDLLSACELEAARLFPRPKHVRKIQPVAHGPLASEK